MDAGEVMARFSTLRKNFQNVECPDELNEHHAWHAVLRCFYDLLDVPVSSPARNFLHQRYESAKAQWAHTLRALDR